MISYIRGELAALEKEKVIVDVGGVGYGIYMPGQAMALLPPTGSEVKIHTYLNVREDAMQLFGFLTRDDLEIFKLLIGVSGIGPKGGLSILSKLSPDDLRYAVLAGDVKAISAAPGIGKKTAEKLIIELKDKLDSQMPVSEGRWVGVDSWPTKDTEDQTLTPVSSVNPSMIVRNPGSWLLSQIATVNSTSLLSLSVFLDSSLPLSFPQAAKPDTIHTANITDTIFFHFIFFLL